MMPSRVQPSGGRTRFHRQSRQSLGDCVDLAFRISLRDREIGSTR